MRLSRIEVVNFRNFLHLDLKLGPHAVIVGENKVGKSNLIHAVRLLLDASLPDSARSLKDEDFWDGLPRPLTAAHRIVISVELVEFDGNAELIALLGSSLIDSDPITARLTYEYRPVDDGTGKLTYEFAVYGGGREENRLSFEVRRRIAVDFIHALRDAEGDLESWRRSPLRPLLDEAAKNVAPAKLESIAKQVQKATDAVTQLDEIDAVAAALSGRLEAMVGSGHAVDATLGFSPTEGARLIRALRLYIDQKRRSIAGASLGTANLIYLALKTLEAEHWSTTGERNHTILAIEEPEAHLHPHLQRLVYRDVLTERGAPAEEKESSKRTVLLTTHSPHIVSVAPLRSLVLLRATPDKGTRGTSTASVELEDTEVLDLERYLDVNRGELVFAKGVLLVEGDAERFIVPVLARQHGYPLDELGIAVCSIAGTHFTPYVRLLRALEIPFALLTDRDPIDGKAALGERRVADLVSLLMAPVAPVDALAEATALGIFMNSHTLEVDLLKAGLIKTTCRSLVDLAATSAARKRAEGWLGAADVDDVVAFMADVNAIGKGRFAQRMSARLGALSKAKCPQYILDALEYLKRRVQ